MWKTTRVVFKRLATITHTSRYYILSTFVDTNYLISEFDMFQWFNLRPQKYDFTLLLLNHVPYGSRVIHEHFVGLAVKGKYIWLWGHNYYNYGRLGVHHLVFSIFLYVDVPLPHVSDSQSYIFLSVDNTAFIYWKRKGVAGNRTRYICILYSQTTLPHWLLVAWYTVVKGKDQFWKRLPHNQIYLPLPATPSRFSCITLDPYGTAMYPLLDLNLKPLTLNGQCGPIKVVDVIWRTMGKTMKYWSI